MRQEQEGIPLNDPNIRQDGILLMMHQYGIPILDLRKAILEADLLPEERFFKTDHHWTAPAAFYATSALVKTMEEQFGEDLDPQGIYCDINSYYQYTYQDSMLGSSGRNAGIVYSGVDDFTLLWPKFETNFTWYDFEHEKEQSGKFEEAFFWKKIVPFTSPYETNPNELYLRVVVKQDRIVNHLNPNGPKILVIRDSYFSPMATFLAPMCSEIDMIWGKETKEASVIETAVEEGTYDYVIVELYPYNIEDAAFNFYKEDSE